MQASPLTGPEAIEHALRKLDLKKLEEQQRQVIRDKKKTARPRAVRILNILRGFERSGLSPDKLMIRSVPVVPPAYRPFSITGETFLPGDANELYKDLFEFKRLYSDAEKILGQDGANEVYADMRKATRALYGFGDSPNPKTKQRGVKGFFKAVTGTSPKTSFWQSRMLSKPVDNVGRAVIVPDADLGMDEVGLPEEQAWKYYGVYVQRRLVRSGMSAADALRHLTNRTAQARKALDMEMPERPVYISRAPAWHDHNVIGQIPKIVEGDAMRVNPYIAEGANADYDGDALVNTMIFAVSKHQISNIPQHLVDKFYFMGDHTSAMNNKIHIPYIDPQTHEVVIADISDFPRSDSLIGEKQGTNSYIRFFHALPGTKVIAYDERRRALVWAEVSGWSEHTAPPVEIVTLSNKRQNFTDDDPRAVYGMDPDTGEMGRWTPTEALQRRVAVPCGRNLQSVLSTLEPINSITVAPGLSLETSYDFGWFLGAMCGDGWWDKRDYDFYEKRGMAGKRSLHISDLRDHNARRTSDFIKKYLGGEGSLHYHRQAQTKKEGDDRYGDSATHSFNFAGSEHVAEFLAQHLRGERDENTAGSANKRLPSFFFRAPYEFRRGLLCGLVDTDGTISISGPKSNGGLNNFAISSTSLLLIRELQLLCATLDIRATVSWSKDTAGGNESWLLTMSIWDCKRHNIFRDLASPDKLSNFVNAEAVRENTAATYNKVVVPRHIFDIVDADLTKPKLTTADRQQESEELTWKKRQQNMSAQWAKAKHEGIVSRSSAREVLSHLAVLYARRQAELDAAMTLLNSGQVEQTATSVEILRKGVFATVRPFSADGARDSEAYKLARIISTIPKSGGFMGELRLRNIRERLSALQAYRGALDSPVLKEWRDRLLDDESVTWATVSEVQKTGKCEVGYDLTVPGYETFMAVNGMILSNTMTAHVPSSPEAVEDVKKRILASNMPWSIKDYGKTMGAPKHEQLLGLFMGQKSSGKVHRFSSQQEANDAIQKGIVNLNDEITIDER